jgi:DNA-binding HxlR family transcriptional regulator
MQVKDIRREDFETLFHRKWSIPILAELKRQGGSKFVTLQNRLDIGPTALRQTLDFLIEKQVIVRNPGYGHPMRPEYILTDQGKPVAAKCKELVDAVDDHKVLRLLLMKWSLPTLIAISQGARRFSELKDAIQSTGRALTIFLKEAQAAGVVERALVDGYPPAAEYRLAGKARRLIPILKSLSTQAAPN